MSEIPAIDDEAAWQAWRAQWNLRGDTIYLNHGSFGPPPRVVCEARREWIDRLDSQPMDFFIRQYEPALLAARERLAKFVQTAEDNIVFAENATAAMNVVAVNHPLAPGDEVLLTNHAYGVVRRIWDRVCQRSSAVLKQAVVPLPIDSAEQVMDAVFAAASGNTRLLVISHVTSPTAAIWPIAVLCCEARRRGIAVCVDGPHAVAQVPLAIDALDCDYYAASCHKWLCAPFGSGFLYVHPRHQRHFLPQQLSWGRIPPAEIATWSDEFLWSGTRDPSAYLSVPAAIDFLQDVGLDRFRARTHYLARYARQRITELTGLEPPLPDNESWYGSMCLAPLPAGDRYALQIALWQQYGIEVPIIEFAGSRYVRVSCHLYNTKQDIDRLASALQALL